MEMVYFGLYPNLFFQKLCWSCMLLTKHIVITRNFNGGTTSFVLTVIQIDTAGNHTRAS